MASPHRHRIYHGVEVKLVSGSRGFRHSTAITPAFSQETHKVSKITKNKHTHTLTHKKKKKEKKSHHIFKHEHWLV